MDQYIQQASTMQNSPNTDNDSVFMSLPCAVKKTTSFKINCLICSQQVNLVSEDANSKPTVERIKVIKTLCYHMQINSTKIPGNFSKAKFPFCPFCEVLVTEMRRNQEIVEEAQRKISQCIKSIETAVMNSEILRIGGSSPKTASAENSFVHLRDKVLEVYRSKLIMKQKLREESILGNEMTVLGMPVCSHSVVMRDISSSRQFKTTKNAAAPSHCNGIRSKLTNVTVSVSQADVGVEMNMDENEDEGQIDNVTKHAVGLYSNRKTGNIRRTPNGNLYVRSESLSPKTTRVAFKKEPMETRCSFSHDF